MSFKILIPLLFITFLVSVAFSSSKDDYHTQFFDWVQLHGKKYQSNEEYNFRFQQWISNMQLIDNHNLQGHSWKMKINHFGDLTSKEFSEYMLCSSCHQSIQNNVLDTFNLPPNPPSYIDWVEKGKVTQIKNQERCGSCYAFSATGALESMMAIKLNLTSLISLSEQELVDCDKYSKPGGCGGGQYDNDFKYIKEKGLCSEEDYPYTGKQSSQCMADKCQSVSSLTLKDWKYIKGEDGMTQSILTQPISTAVESTKWQFYSGGIYNASQCKTELNHEILVVGLVEKDGQTAWKIKNSWGIHWGEDGYIYLPFGVNACNLAAYPVTPNILDFNP